jgi:phosphoenolpyruvate-protein kinase (PTS system EI component)
VVANDLSPADTIQFKTPQDRRFRHRHGRQSTSHTAIVARSLAIPAVVGMQHARPLIQDDDLLIVDGTRGVLIVDPTPSVLAEYRLRKSELARARQAQAPGDGPGAYARRRGSRRSTPTSNCRRTPNGRSKSAPTASACSAPSSSS